MSPLDKALHGFLPHESPTVGHPGSSDTVIPLGDVPGTAGHEQSNGAPEAPGSDPGLATGLVATPRTSADVLAASDEDIALALSPATLHSTLAETLVGSSAARPTRTRLSRLRGWTRRGASALRSSMLQALGFLRAVKSARRRDGSDSTK